MASIFKNILADGLRRGYAPNKTLQARNWFRRQALQTTSTSNQVYQRAEIQDFRTVPTPGSLYFFYYDPKWKDKLPVYDIFPCSLIYQMTKDGFYGLNFHYLPHVYRAALFDALMEYTSDETYDEKTKIMISYAVMKRTFRLRYYRDCIKRYLTPHLRSRLVYVPPSEWDIALFLPVENFNNSNILFRQHNQLGFRSSSNFK